MAGGPAGPGTPGLTPGPHPAAASAPGTEGPRAGRPGPHPGAPGRGAGGPARGRPGPGRGVGRRVR
ncbi:hypothetical protein D9753_30045 [Streptomyces dangxiongensis]|uniref:Uncharacterized protein n=1 Tax=Streptomyces dangxiongensis TaxID=1442032 RepID=A0A3G2JJC2_9ACTN|nr:hypothetical protein D9753_30045 [Streptomyces dangxiongensis]